jgi:hypothetical protein
MTPKQFYAKWEVDYEIIANICDRSTSTVQCWFVRGRNYRRPTLTDLRHLVQVAVKGVRKTTSDRAHTTVSEKF